jgi:hypothetical protein
MNQRCTARTDQGLPCRNWAVRGSDPPRCGSHRGGRRPPGAPYGNRNAQIHGRCARPRPVPRTVESVVADLAAHHAFLTTFLPADPAYPLPTVPECVLVRLLVLYARSSLHLGRVLRRTGILSPTAVAALLAAWGATLAQLQDGTGPHPSPDPAAGAPNQEYCSA